MTLFLTVPASSPGRRLMSRAVSTMWLAALFFSSVKPLKPSLRQKRTTVAGLVPVASAREFAVAPARRPGSPRMYPAMLSSAFEKLRALYIAFIFCTKSRLSSMFSSRASVRSCL